ncbi:serine O-acetyltransferase EpsC [Streptomyces silvisoli]|uniref:serine O-acetyltransferase n=1 Tax=Streptomyces silvisoli TaxID=3034235 RepID=A0ABT5ZVT5_9ACTN|nr:serine O-acetyltransferase EpsC [Streptomyces silvisoli]MDF3293938.1 serine O-acetyltransferase [Streptomyces silvisoli]
MPKQTQIPGQTNIRRLADKRTRGESRLALRHQIWEDVDTILARDPSITTHAEAMFHSALPAVWMHRVAHRLYRKRHRISARVLTNVARVLTGVEIHPGARVGRRLFIDHGTGVVIGETAVLGDDVTIYQQVTLGAVGWWRDNQRRSGERRHPVVGDRVTLGANATVLGPLVIGDDAMLGAHALVLKDVGPGQRVLAEPSNGWRTPQDASEEGA